MSIGQAFESLGRDVVAVRREVERVMLGQRDVLDEVLCAVVGGGHVLLEGVPGTGKTRLVTSLARALGLDMGRIQFTPDLMPADITGTTIVADSNDARRGTVFRPGPVFHQVILADEINRATPRTQSALLEAMQERTVTVGSTTHDLPEPFVVLATQNPIDQEGVHRLPEAQLDRFMMKVVVGRPGCDVVADIVGATTGVGEHEIEPPVDVDLLRRAQSLVAQVIVAPHVDDWIARLVLATSDASLGGEIPDLLRSPCSPRAGIALRRCAQVAAVCDGRAAASCQDVHRVLAPCLRHRMQPGPEAMGRGLSPDDLVGLLVDAVPTPAQRVLKP